MAKTPTNGRKKTKAQLKEELEKEIREEIKEEQHKKEKIWSGVLDVLDTIAMIVAAGSGIILSKYIPEFAAGGDVIFMIPSWGRLIISFALAMGVIAMTEVKGSKVGKRKNFVKRLWFAFANGMAWHTITGF
jgi:hypothetical protein